jgi:hypothetical protein
MRVVSRGDTVPVDHHERDRFRLTRRRVLYVQGTNGSVRALEGRRVSEDSTQGDVEERFEIDGRTARWQSAIDSGSVTVDGPTFYQPYSDTPWGMGQLARYLPGRTNHTAPLLPVGSGRAVIAADTVLELESERRRLRLVMIHDVHEPDGAVGVWLDEGCVSRERSSRLERNDPARRGGHPAFTAGDRARVRA